MALVQARAGIPVLPLEGLAARASALADRFHGEPSARLEVFGVTGTNGKTSVAHYLAQALGAELSCGIVGTLGNGFPGALKPTTHTTPDAVALQATLAGLSALGAGAVAMEISSHALDQSRAAAVRFSHAIFTNLSRDHLDYHGDMDAYGAAKRRLFVAPGLRWAVLNLDDPFHTQVLAGLAANVRVAAYGLDARAPLPERCDLWVRAAEVQPLPLGLHLRIETSLGAGELDAALIGAFNASNLLAVLAVMLSRGLPLERALRELARVRGVPGRMECFGGNGAPLVVVDYAHTPDALEKALTNLRLHQSRRVITVVGCGGDRDRGKRPLMGAIAERLSDALILTDDNPRSERGDAIIGDILGGVSRPDAVRVARQRGLAIRLAIALAGTGDAVLVAGKGHETTQDMGELKVHFSDRAQVVEALREWREGHH
jgi:UDP-N-acetylmuramoyl-L-alanyl-D-glutamate--2,6-diaminopimelate ligase